MRIHIRPEKPSDVSLINQITIDAFSPIAYASHTEHLIIDALRKAEGMTLSLVADINGLMVGHIAFSAITIDGKNRDWYCLGPISVQPNFQKAGIGSRLIKTGISMIRDMGGRGCVLEGSPTYYQRFGFKAYPGLILDGAPTQEYFMALPFFTNVPEGKVRFHEAFYLF